MGAEKVRLNCEEIAVTAGEVKHNLNACPLLNKMRDRDGVHPQACPGSVRDVDDINA